MQPINCVIIEDEEKASELLKSMLEEFCEGVVVKESPEMYNKV